VALGEMDRFVEFYRSVMGFSQLIHYDDKVIHTEYSALMSKVMQNGNGRIKFPINEPASGKKKSQIQEFLDWYLDDGTQHIALRTTDIVGTVRTLRERGVEFLGMPHTYYEALPERVGDVGVPMQTLEELGIEADRDE
jgi:4-hydroxyphenylpyruvate dioxygenase